MKPFIRLTAFLIAAVAFTGCSKTILVQDEPISGTWVLTDAAHKDVYGWYGVTTGVEHGVFTFYNNGSARYREGNIEMQGNWQISTVTGGYYDEYGNYYTDRHQSLEVYLSDYYGDETINMYFENVRINNNSFVATNYNNHYIERYRFSRY